MMGGTMILSSAFFVNLLLGWISPSAAATPAAVSPASTKTGAVTAPPGLPLDFIENRGQWDPRVKFAARQGSMAAFLEQDRIRLQLSDGPGVSLNFEGASKAPKLLGDGKRSTQYNFYVGNDPSQWQSQVPAYESVRYSGLYDGVDVRVREAAGRRLAYDLMLEPKVDLNHVVIRTEG